MNTATAARGTTGDAGDALAEHNGDPLFFLETSRPGIFAPAGPNLMIRRRFGSSPAH
jgi:hypothetical protein